MKGGPYAPQPRIILDALNKAIGAYESGELPSKAPKELKSNLKDKKELKALTEEALKNLSLPQMFRLLSIGSWLWIVGVVFGVFILGVKLSPYITPFLEKK